MPIGDISSLRTVRAVGGWGSWGSQGERTAMKDAYVVLYQKEADLARVRKEIESLTLSAQLLAEEEANPFDQERVSNAQNRKPAQKVTSAEPKATVTEPFVWPRSGFWGSLRIRR